MNSALSCQHSPPKRCAQVVHLFGSLLIKKVDHLSHSQDLVLALEEEGKLLANMYRLAAGQAKRLQVCRCANWHSKQA